jgi:hypothetical protein
MLTPALRRAAAACVAAMAVGAIIASTAQAAFVDIGSPRGPLTHIYIGDALACQAFHTGDTRGEFFGSQTGPASCGTAVAVPDPVSGTSTVYGFRNTPLTPVSQSVVTGRGTAADPRRVTTVADAGSTGVRITEVTSYTDGDESYRSDVTLSSPAAINVVLYHAADCYLQNTDRGYGFFDAVVGAIFCTQNPNNRPAGRLLGFRPLTTPSNYEEGHYATVFGDVGKAAPLPDTCGCTTLQDNGAGLSWSASLPADVPQRYSFVNVFSPSGSTSGAPPPNQVPPPVPGRSTNAVRLAGRVLVKVPGSGRFVDLNSVTQLPVGTTVDATRGAMRLTAAKDLAGHVQSAAFSKGQFLIRQVRAARMTTDLVLNGGNFRDCLGTAARAAGRSGPARSARGHSRSKRRIRSLWGDGQGSFRTRGRYSSATVRGTAWRTVDRCDGTLTAVSRGVVRVRDFVRARTVAVRAGHSYLARPR